MSEPSTVSADKSTTKKATVPVSVVILVQLAIVTVEVSAMWLSDQGVTPRFAPGITGEELDLNKLQIE